MLEVRGLGKKLTRDLALARRHGASDILRDLRFAPGVEETRSGEFWALRDIDLEVAPGEAVGVIGHNGAGKSTLLRVLHGLTRPDAGSVTVRGRHAALLDLGAPFDKVLSGRENVTVAAAVHGVPRRQIGTLAEAVAEFSELGDVLDAPMRTYSAGMQMRLGFAIAAQLDAKLLLVDEVITVGDISFQRKCMSHIRRHLGRGGSLVLVSHDLWMVQTLCQRCIVLSEGRIVAEGTANHAISSYMGAARRGQVFVPRARQGFTATSAGSAPAARAEVVACRGPDGRPPRNGDDLIIEIEAHGDGSALSAGWYVDVLTPDRQICVARLQPPDTTGHLELSAEPTAIAFTVPKVPLFPGTFFLSVHLLDGATGEEVGASEAPLAIEVESRADRMDTLAQFAGALSSVETSYSLGGPPTEAAVRSKIGETAVADQPGRPPAATLSDGLGSGTGSGRRSMEDEVADRGR